MAMLTAAFVDLFERDLLRLRDEIAAYPDDDLLWVVRPGIANSGGNLALHLVGNLAHFVGAVLGHTGYERQRDLEFSTRGMSRAALIGHIEHTAEVVTRTLNLLGPDDWQQNYPLQKNGQTLTMTQMIAHLYGHLSYHLGQINYHRRLLSPIG
jgi:hypothetical protein